MDLKRISKEEVLAALDIEQFYSQRIAGQLKPQGTRRWKGPCPFHTDSDPSLSIERKTGRFKCFGCGASGSVFDFEMRLRGVDFATALYSLAAEAGLETATGEPARRLVETYDWRDAEGNLVWQKLRYLPKDFQVRRPDGNGDWIWNIDGVPPMLYHADLIAAAEDNEPVWIFEGEKDADEGMRIGVLGTTSGSATSWKPELAPLLAGRRVHIVPHKDAEGESFAHSVASSLHGLAASVRIVRLPGMAHKGADFADWVAAGGTKDELLALAEAAPEWEPEESRPVAAVDVKPARYVVPAWPDPLAPEALHGLAGDFVRLVEPHTEADSAAILVSLLVGFGNLVGDGPHFKVEFVKHPPRLDAVLVGDTAKARKGQSWATPRRLLTGVDPAWEQRVKEGLSSGEGLIYQVRDQRTESQPIKKRGGEVTGYQDVIVDQGVDDKRLLIVEQEFSQALKMMSREGNILSVTIRQAWDSGRLSPLTKTNPIEATGAHVSILGHITREELLRHLTETEQANGFANRFLWMLVRRSKLLPSPKPIPEATLSALASRLKAAVEFAEGMGEMQRDPAAEAFWCEVYPRLSEGRPGLLGAITARAEAQTMRLALIYALLDCSPKIGVEHLGAGLALWRYYEQSAARIFGDSLGEPKADRILRAIRETGGISENEICNLFNRHDPAGIDRALGLLHRLGLAHPVVLPTGGRPKTIWEPGDARNG